MEGGERDGFLSYIIIKSGSRKRERSDPTIRPRPEGRSNSGHFEDTLSRAGSALLGNGPKSQSLINGLKR